MPCGYTGKILHVDLTQAKIETEEPAESFYRTYMGGSAMGVYYVLRDTKAETDALSPENVLTLMNSVVTGAGIAGQSRISANARSPFTGAIGDSQAGGFFPAELKFAGVDGIVFKGRSPKPVYLAIIDGKAELHDAAHLAGKVTGDAEDAIKNELGDPKIQVLQHGPAAEKGVRFSSLVNMCSRNNGRTGMGLVMASKNLRAVAVRGTKKPAVADARALAALNKLGVAWIPTNGDVKAVGEFGTASVVLPQNSSGTLPTRNYNEGQFESAETISGERMADTILIRRETCFACTVRCKRVVEVKEGPYPVDPRYGGPEYETIGTFGSYCGIDNLAAIARANQICNMHGVDTISGGATIAFAMECFEKGIITTRETGGIELRFGNADAMLAVLEQIVTASGALGRVLSQGSARAAKVWGKGAEELLITVKNQEAPAHMPQAKKTLALIYAVNPFGADHQSSEHDPMYEAGLATDLYLKNLAQLGLTNPPAQNDFGPEKVRFAYLGEVFYSLMDTLDLCQFVWGPAWCLFGPAETVEMVKAVTGWDVTLDELMDVGRRRLNLLRTFNARAGFTRKEDKLPAKFFKPLAGSGPTAGVAVNEADFTAALNQYYQLNGWTSDGIPTPHSLKQLKLDWAVQYLP